MQFVWERKKPTSSFAAGSVFSVLCEVINCVLAPGSVQVASGFAEVAFSGIAPIARKRVLICALAVSQGTLWQNPGSFFRGSADAVTLQDYTHPALITQLDLQSET